MPARNQNPLDWIAPLDTPFEPGAVFVPELVRVRDGVLLFDLGRPTFRVPRGSVLDRFRRLHGQTDQDICKFAGSFGVAWFCQHHIPGSHVQVPFGGQFGMEKCFPIRDSAEGFLQCHGESLDDYRRFSLAADSIITASGTVNAGEIPSNEIFASFAYENQPLTLDVAAFPRYALSDPARVPKQVMLDCARMRIAEEINVWIAVSQARPRLTWDHRGKGWSQGLLHSPWGVLGAVALALFTTAPQSQGWLLCSIPECRQIYSPKYPAVPGRNHYCPKHKDTRAMWALLKRQARAKQKENAK